ncbi:hypothetical protein BY996DRAFT_1857966 [Phakopsora pachyrhizi]|uniref:Expressed protein n=1 Tax=Phakopsora pachyrhizi TaxID=170000 RepID=A0AAV0BL83_PHAPC|nr:hypothetical protein BY996DRAFT_1857966 [Phakopsora pachyrhizi]CAH7687093.1 expressed protein [Phakopsora pachyrhizi]
MGTNEFCYSQRQSYHLSIKIIHPRQTIILSKSLSEGETKREIEMYPRRDNHETRNRSNSTRSVSELTARLGRSSSRAGQWVGNQFRRGEGYDGNGGEELWGTSYERHADQYHREEVPNSNFYSTTRMASRQDAQIGSAPRTQHAQPSFSQRFFGSTGRRRDTARPGIPESFFPNIANSRSGRDLYGPLDNNSPYNSSTLKDNHGGKIGGGYYNQSSSAYPSNGPHSGRRLGSRQVDNALWPGEQSRYQEDYHYHSSGTQQLSSNIYGEPDHHSPSYYSGRDQSYRFRSLRDNSSRR